MAISFKKLLVLLNAGNEVSNALHLYQMEKDKAVSRIVEPAEVVQQYKDMAKEILEQ